MVSVSVNMCMRASLMHAFRRAYSLPHKYGHFHNNKGVIRYGLLPVNNNNVDFIYCYTASIHLISKQWTAKCVLTQCFITVSNTHTLNHSANNKAGMVYKDITGDHYVCHKDQYPVCTWFTPSPALLLQNINIAIAIWNILFQVGILRVLFSMAGAGVWEQPRL